MVWGNCYCGECRPEDTGKKLMAVCNICGQSEHTGECDPKNVIARLNTKIERYEKALLDIDSWQGKQICDMSVYEIDDDEFLTLQTILHLAMERK